MPSKDKTKSKGTPRERSFKRTVLFLAVTLVLTVLSFSPSLDNGFTNWDDPGYVLENYSIRDLSQKNVANVFTSYLQGNYHPLTVLSYAVEYKFFQLDPKIYHITNLLLHVLNTTFVFWLIRLLTGRLETAAITAVLFGIHPLHVESVAWISERKDVLFSLFYLGSLISYVLSLTKVQDRVRYLIMSLVLFILSLLSKGVAVTLPLVLLLIDYYFKRTFTKKIFIEKIPFFLLSIGFGVIAILAQKSEGAIQTMTTYPFYDRLLIASYGIVTYLCKIVVPQQLSAFYPYPLTTANKLPLLFYIAPLIVVLLGMLTWRSVRHTTDGLLGGLFFLITIALVLQLLPVGKTMMADRYTYLPSIGIFFILGQGYYRISHHRNPSLSRFKPVMIIIGICYISLFLYLTRKRCEVWKDSLTLWNDVIKKDPMVPDAYGNRGYIYFTMERYDAAIADLNKALEINPSQLEALNTRGAVYLNQGLYDQAFSDFNRAIQIKPDFWVAYLNRANVYSIRKEFATALHDYDNYLQFDEHNANAYYWRGLAKSNLGDHDGALLDYSTSIKINPQLSGAYYERSRIYDSRKEFEKALKDALTAKRLGYHVDDAYLNQLQPTQPNSNVP